MKSYLTVLDGDMQLLPFWIPWQQRLGATRFHAQVYGTTEDACRLEQTAAMTGARVIVDYIAPAEQFTIDNVNGRQFTSTIDDWAFVSDIDEFPEPFDLAAAIEHAEAQGVDFISGGWLNRVAGGGELPDVEHGRPLEEQFPMVFDHAWQGTLGATTALVLARKPPRNHHEGSPTLRVHHFKWTASLINRLRRRSRRVLRDLRGRKAANWADKLQLGIESIRDGKLTDVDLRYAGSVLGI